MKENSLQAEKDEGPGVMKKENEAALEIMKRDKAIRQDGIRTKMLEALDKFIQQDL